MDRRRLWLLGLPIGAAALMLIGIAIGFALKTRPHRVSLETLSHLAQRYYREGRYDEARILYESVLGAGHRMPVAEFFLANILAKEGRLDEARERYRQLTGDPLLHQAALVNLGVSYYLQGLTNEALACFTDYVARYGENPGFLLDRARLAADLLSGQATDETKMRRAAE